MSNTASKEVVVCFLCKRNPKAPGLKVCQICYDGIHEDRLCECRDPQHFDLTKDVRWCGRCDRRVQPPEPGGGK